jgi:glycosyltransferase involved in cell wall biosynthesis
LVSFRKWLNGQLVYPSFFEGFGIPIVEAMYCDAPVTTSNVSSMLEVSGDAVLIIDPHSVDSIANAMLQPHKDNVMRSLRDILS